MYSMGREGGREGGREEGIIGRQVRNFCTVIYMYSVGCSVKVCQNKEELCFYSW